MTEVIQLFQGSGIIDGPIEVESSTYSKLGGFTALLLLATALAKFLGNQPDTSVNFDGTLTANQQKVWFGCSQLMENRGITQRIQITLW